MSKSDHARWDSSERPSSVLEELESELVQRFGASRLEETAWPVYTNRMYPARWLGYERLRVAERLTYHVGRVPVAVDFGSGLGVSLPFLAARAERVYAVELDAAVTGFVVDRLGLTNVTVVDSVERIPEAVDLLWALDVFEHVDELATLCRALAERTSIGGWWVVSGPTENGLYHLMRRVARTSGEGHVRGVDRVFQIVSRRLALVRSQRLPLDLPLWASLFDVGLFRRLR